MSRVFFFLGVLGVYHYARERERGEGSGGVRRVSLLGECFVIREDGRGDFCWVYIIGGCTVQEATVNFLRWHNEAVAVDLKRIAHVSFKAVVCDESGHIKFPFSYFVRVTLLTLVQARLSRCSGFAQAGSHLHFRQVVAQPVKRFNSSRGGPELVPYIKIG